MSLIGTHIKRYGGGYATLIGAVTALIVAVNGYLELMRKDELVYEALSSKVNHMAAELSELKGQNSVMLVFLQSKLGGEILPPAEELELVPIEAPGAVRAAKPRLDRKASGKMRPKPKPRMKIKAFQDLPADLDSLIKNQEQLQAK